MSLRQQFTDSMLRYLPDGGRIVVGFSGGVDSRVLLRLAVEYRACYPSTSIVAVHVHHGLSDKADHWLALCEQWAKEEKVEFVAEHVQLNLNSGDSIEQQARHARYQAINQHMTHDDVLITGQHLDDQAETFLLAVKRGSGPKGLSSMAVCMPFGKGSLVRPLLNAQRQDIEQFANDEALQWLEDESNQDTRFDRNFLRHEVMPLLSSRWPSFSKAVNRSARLCAKQERLLEELLKPELEACLDRFMGIKVEALNHFSELKRDQLLRMWLESQVTVLPSEVQLQKLWQEVALARVDANPQIELSGGVVRRFRGYLYWIAKQADVTSWTHALTLEEPLALPDDLGILSLKRGRSGDSTMTLECAKLTGALSVTFNPEGLSAHPHGRSGSRKLKKLFQEYQVPSWQRRRTPILMMNGIVVAVGNLFVDKDFYGSDCELVWDK